MFTASGDNVAITDYLQWVGAAYNEYQEYHGE
jgi:hypothetical protein